MLITGASIAAFLGRGAAADFDLLAEYVDGWIKGRSDREFERAQRVEWPINDSRTLSTTIALREYPIASIDEVRISLSGVFDDVTQCAIPDVSKFLISDSRGESNEVEYRYGFFFPGTRCVQVTYTAGWWPYGDVDVLHLGPRVPAHLDRLLHNVATILDDAGVLEIFPVDRRGNFHYTHYESLIPPHLVEMADTFKRW